MLVTIEGVQDSDRLKAGERTTVELTDLIRGLLRSRLVKVVWPEQEAETAVVDEDPPVVEEVADAVEETESSDEAADEPPAPKARRPRRTPPDDAE